MTAAHTVLYKFALAAFNCGQANTTTAVTWLSVPVFFITGTRLNARAIYVDFSSLFHACCACITKLHVGLLKLHSIADTVVHRSVITTIKHMYTTHTAFGFMLLAAAYFVSF